MCSNYDTITDEQRLLTHLGVAYRSEREAVADAARRNLARTVWPTTLAPFIRLHEDGSGNRVAEEERFGLLQSSPD